MKKNILYAQSGGATATINASACGVIETACLHPDKIHKVYAGKNGILGILNEELIDVNRETREAIAALKHTPACIFGSCRYKLKDPEQDDTEYRRLIEVFAAHDIAYFFYNGGNDSQDTAQKIARMSQKLNYPLQVIGIPKTIDNDLACSDNSPGFGSVAKYVATSVYETALDVKCMSASSTKVFILEVMGRHAGWIAAAAALAKQHADDAPHIILFPEIPFDPDSFLQEVQNCVKKHDYCVIVVSEGTKDKQGRFLHETHMTDAFGHEQLGGVAPILARLIKHKLGLKIHWAVSDYLQRAARHLASQTDVEQSYALGKAAVEHALAGQSGIMLTIERQPSDDYLWQIGTAPLNQVANREKKMPRDFISANGYDITQSARQYLLPLIQGESYPPYHQGLPAYAKLNNFLVEKKLTNIDIGV